MAQYASVLSILVTANSAQATRSLAALDKQMAATSGKAQGMGKVLGTALKVGALGVGAGMAYAVTKAADFEQQLDSLGSVAGANGKQMERLRKQALKQGAATKYSALEAAEAQTELAKGGLKVKSIMGGGLKSALALAAAGELDLADAATYTANAMNLFGLKGKATIKIADQLATAANSTTADVADFGEALKQGGAVAKSAGYSFSETVLVLEALAKSGIKNSDAGTSLKTAFIQLIKPSTKQLNLQKELNLEFINSAGNLKSAAGISEMLREKLGGMTKAQRTATLATLAGTDGVRTLTALYDAGVPRLEKWRGQLDRQGTAAEVAAKKQDNFRGKLEQLQGSVETAAIAIGSKWLPTLTKAAEQITDIINDKRLTSGQKFDKLAKMASEAFSSAIQVMAEQAAKAAPKIASAFVNAWAASDVWAKLVIGGFLLAKMGGLKAFFTLGASAGKSFGLGLSSSAASTAGAGAAAGGIAGGVFGGVKGKLMKLAAGPGLAAVALVAADTLINRISDRMAMRGDDIFKALKANGDPSKVLGIGFEDIVGKTDDTKNAENLSKVLGQIRDKNKAISLDQAKTLKDSARFLDLTREQKQQMSALLDVGVDRYEKLAGNQRKAAAMSDQFAKNLAGLRLKGSADFDALTQSVVFGSKQILKVGGGKSKETRQEIATQFDIARQRIKDAMDKSVISVKEGGARLHDLAVKQLALYGIKAGKVDVVLAKGANGEMRPNQRGGYQLGGKPSGDSIPSLLERGEYVVNRKAVAKVGRENLDRLNFGAAPRFQKGGIVGLGQELQREGYQVGEHPAFGGVNPVHTGNSYHYKGMALDVNADSWPGGEPAALDKLYARLQKMSGIVELLWRTDGHFDHLHVAMGGSGGVLGALGPAFKGLDRVMLKGAPSVMTEAGQGLLDRVRGAADAAISRVADASGGPGASFGSFSGFSGAWTDLMAKIAQERGWSLNDWKTLVNKESGGNPAAVNPSSGAYGLGQFLGSTKDAYAKYGATSPDGVDQIRAMAQYISDRYGDPSKALGFHLKNNWYAKGGLVGYFGDSLGQGTVGAGLAGKLGKGIQLVADNVQGRAPGATLGALKGKGLKGLDALVFDVGSNGSASDLGSAIGGAKGMPGGLIMATLAGQVQELAKKNGLIKSGADKVVDWASVAAPFVGGDPQGIHASGAGYDKRASMMVAAIKQMLPDNNGSKDGGVGTKSGYILDPHGRKSVPQVLSKRGRDFNELVTPEKATFGERLERTEFFLRKASKPYRAKKLRGLLSQVNDIDLPKNLLSGLKKYEDEANIAADYAERASQLNFDVVDANGDPVLDAERRPMKQWAVVNGKTEVGWVEGQLSALFTWRNKILAAKEKVDEVRKRVTSMIATVQKHLKTVAAAIRKAGNEKKQLENQIEKDRKKLDDLREKPKKNKGAIDELRTSIMGKVARVKEIAGAQSERVRVKKGLGRVQEALVGRREYLGGKDEELAGNLVTVQGVGSPMERLTALPEIGVLGGDIMTAQLRLRDLAVKPNPITDSTAAAAADAVDNTDYKELLRQANLRTALSEANYKTISTFPQYNQLGTPFMGAFAKGGVALVGEQGPELAHLPSGTRIHSNGDTQSMLSPTIVINGDIVNTPRGKDPVEVLLGDHRLDAKINRAMSGAVDSMLRPRI